MSLDGKIATRSGDSRISSETDLMALHKLRSQSDAVMIGIGTELIDDPLLTVRFVKGKNPIRVVVDSSARIPLSSKILKTDPSSVLIASSRKAAAYRLAELENVGATVIRCGRTKVDLNRLLRILYQRGIDSILLEGGGTLNWSMLRDRLVDKVHVTISPMLIGGDRATTLVEGFGVPTIKKSFRLRLSRMHRHANEIILEYKVNRND